MLNIKTIQCKGFEGQNPGTSGLRKKVKVFQQEYYVESYIQSVFNALRIKGKSIVIGGDGRYYNKEALHKILCLAVANNVKSVLVAKDALLSTPAASHIIRKYKLDYGIILSASHNPAGINGDFGIKINISNGAPANVDITDLIFKETKSIGSFNIFSDISVDISKISKVKILNTTIEVIDGADDYVALMEEIFDFDLIKEHLAQGKSKFLFNSFYGITSSYAKKIFIDKLGVSEKFLLNVESKEDFGNLIPDPNPVSANDFVNKVRKDKSIDLGFACDADGDRNFIFSRNNFLEPSDSLAIMLEYAYLLPYYKDRLMGVARSKATSPAVDLVAEKMGISHYIVPTGWKYFSSLLDVSRVTLCGEESFGTGSNHVREKDGIWAILFWLNILAKLDLSLDDILYKLWSDYGRVYFSRYDFEKLEEEVAENFISSLDNAKDFLNKDLGHGYILEDVSNFSYRDITTNVKVDNQGLVLKFNNNAEIIIRKSGTGTEGVTIRAYFHQHEKDNSRVKEDKAEYLKNLSEVFFKIVNISTLKPDVVI